MAIGWWILLGVLFVIGAIVHAVNTPLTQEQEDLVTQPYKENPTMTVGDIDRLPRCKFCGINANATTHRCKSTMKGEK